MTGRGGEGTVADREAAQWLARLNGRVVGTDELAEFSAWRRKPGNADAYARAERAWDRTEALGDDRDIALAVRDALERPERERRFPWFAIRSAPVIAGMLALLIAIGAAALLLDRPAHYTTAIGEQRMVQLEDGSRVRINTDSAIDVRLKRDRRQVTLLRGEAYFDVTHDAARPFSVDAGAAQVRAIGTAFNINRSGDDTVVTLLRGKVDVRSSVHDGTRRTLAPGQQVVAGPTTLSAPVTVDVDALIGWTSGNLSFRDTPLIDAIAEVNRYTLNRIALEANDIRTQRVNGTFQTGDTAAFIAAVTALYPLRAIHQPDGQILLTH
jgi:transmembrane sensor